jgi:hypothetical protein
VRSDLTTRVRFQPPSGERASSGSPVVNMWKRFQMPAQRRKGPQRPIAVACAPLVGRRSPDAARWGRRRRGHLTSPESPRRNAWTFSGGHGFRARPVSSAAAPLHARPSGAAGGALCRLRATFAHPNAYPQTNYGAVVAGQSIKEIIVLIAFSLTRQSRHSRFLGSTGRRVNAASRRSAVERRHGPYHS